MARSSRLAGQGADLGSQWVAGQTQQIRHSVEQGAHLAARLATRLVHAQETMSVNAADRVIDTYQPSKAAGQAMREGAVHAGDATRQAVSPGIEVMERAAGHTYDAPTGSAPALNNARHPDNPHHALYNKLHWRIPEASENRLVQFTAACHTNRITADNLPRSIWTRRTCGLAFVERVSWRHPPSST